MMGPPCSFLLSSWTAVAQCFFQPPYVKVFSIDLLYLPLATSHPTLFLILRLFFPFWQRPDSRNSKLLGSLFLENDDIDKSERICDTKILKADPRVRLFQKGWGS